MQGLGCDEAGGILRGKNYRGLARSDGTRRFDRQAADERWRCSITSAAVGEREAGVHSRGSFGTPMALCVNGAVEGRWREMRLQNRRAEQLILGRYWVVRICG
jgi:hypothetical protein